MEKLKKMNENQYTWIFLIRFFTWQRNVAVTWDALAWILLRDQGKFARTGGNVRNMKLIKIKI